MNSDKIEQNTFRNNVEDKNLLLEQYKTYVDSAEKISDRRLKTNEFFLGLNTALLAALGFIKSDTWEQNATSLVVLASLGGIVICYLWFNLILSHKNLNGAKFLVVHEIEKKLPASPFFAEWEIVGKGKDKKSYWPFSHIEIMTPWVFMAIYVTVLVIKMTILFF